MYKTKKEASLVQKHIKNDLKILKENIDNNIKCKIKSYVYDDSSLYYVYFTVSYSLNDFNYGDDIVEKAFKKSNLKKYFSESGSGAGFGARDISYYQTKKIKVENV